MVNALSAAMANVDREIEALREIDRIEKKLMVYNFDMRDDALRLAEFATRVSLASLNFAQYRNKAMLNEVRSHTNTIVSISTRMNLRAGDIEVLNDRLSRIGT